MADTGTPAIVSAVVERLAGVAKGLTVENFPERPNEYVLRHPVGALLVAYTGRKFAGAAQMGEVASQMATLSIAITVVMKQLNGSSGALAALDLIRPHLMGFAPPGCKPITLLREKFLGQHSGAWQYVVELETTLLNTAAQQVADSPLIKQMDFIGVDDAIYAQVPRAE